MDTDEAWNDFQQSRSIKKASISEKLDTIAAQLNEIQTDSARTAELVPKILGDESAIETSNAEMPPMDPSMMGMGGMPPTEGMGDAMPGAEEMSPDGMDLGTGEDMTDDETIPQEEELPTGGEEQPAGDSELFGEAESDIGDEEAPIPEEGAEMPMPEDEMGDVGGTDNTLTALINMLHEKVDEGNMADVKALADAIEQLGGDMDGGMGVSEDYTPDMGQPPIPMDDAAIADEGVLKSDSALGAADASIVDGDTIPKQASADDSNESVVEKVMDILTEAQMEVADTIQGEDAPEGESEGAPTEEGVAIEIDAEPEEEPEEEAESSEETEDAPEADLSEEDETPFKECDSAPTGPTKKSIEELSCKDIFYARMEGRDIVSELIQKSAGETNGYNEFDPWGLSRRKDMFAKSETVADEVSQPPEAASANSGSADSSTVADDVKAPSDHLKGSSAGGDMLDDVDEEKSASENSPKEGEPLDDVDEKKGTSDNKVGDKDLLDDIDENKSSSEGSHDGKDLLDDVKTMKSAKDAGIEIMSMRDLMAIKKSANMASRPDCVSSYGGDLSRPELGKLQKSVTPEPVKMGRGVDPRKVVEADWAEYNLYKAQFKS